MNQEVAPKQPDETHWSSHYKALINLIFMYASIVEVINYRENYIRKKNRREFVNVLENMQSFEIIACSFDKRRIRYHFELS